MHISKVYSVLIDARFDYAQIGELSEQKHLVAGLAVHSRNQPRIVEHVTIYIQNARQCTIIVQKAGDQTVVVSRLAVVAVVAVVFQYFLWEISKDNMSGNIQKII